MGLVVMLLVAVVVILQLQIDEIRRSVGLLDDAVDEDVDEEDAA
jgi:predicted Holliday junction resolvase-like endonuclease